MKIFNSNGSKERLFEMMGRVNKININENINEFGGQSLNQMNVLNLAFGELVGKKLNIEQAKTYAGDNESFVELMAIDKQGNNITFTFKVSAFEGDQDGVYDINNAIMTSFTFDGTSGDVVELDEKGLSQFNMKHKNEIVGVVSDYADFEKDVPEIDEAYLDAIKKIDSYPFGGTPRTMQTGQAYGDEKPTNSNVRVKAPELNKFVDEEVTIGTTGIMGGTPKPTNPSTKSPIESLPEEKKNIIKTAINNITVKKGKREYAPTAAEIQAEINRMKSEKNQMGESDERTMSNNGDSIFITTGQYSGEKAFDSLSSKNKNVVIRIAQRDVDNQLRNNGINVESFMRTNYDEYIDKIKKLALIYFEQEYSRQAVNEDNNYPDPIGKKFKTKSKYPKQKKKPQTTVSIDENEDDVDILAQKHDEDGEKLVGGLGDDKSPKNFDPEQVSLGIKVEMEHTDDPMEALEIALDHLTEDPEYYTVKDDPEASAQFNAASDAEEKSDEEPDDSQDDEEETDKLLGFKPKNVGDYADESAINELNTSTYADLMNKTSEYPWVRYFSKNPDKYTNPKEPGTQQERINNSARDRFVSEFYKEFPKGSVIINTNEGRYKFSQISFRSNFTYYDVIFESMDDGIGRFLWIMPSGNDYYIDKKGLEITDNNSDKMIRELLKYNKK